MNTELKKRILTSLVLFPIFISVLVYSGFFLIFFLLILFFLCFIEIDKNSKSVKFISLASLFLCLSFTSFYYLRGQDNESLFHLLWILFSTFLSDIGGFTFGKIFKGKKLTSISPNKTYSGSIGSFFLSLVSLPILNYSQNYFFGISLINFFTFKFFLLTLLISIIAQLGDIYISYWKRQLKIKDTGNLLPGHGGILDRIDGLIFVVVCMSIFKYFKIF